MDRKINWSILASDEFRKTLKYWIVKNGNNYYAKYLFDETIKTTNLISKYPEIGRRTSSNNIRRIVIDKTFAVYYSYDKFTINIKLWRSLKMNPGENQYEP